MFSPSKQSKKELLEDIANTMAAAQWEYARGKITRNEYMKWVQFCRSAYRGHGKTLDGVNTEVKSKEQAL